jgi:hypothetical protein
MTETTFDDPLRQRLHETVACETDGDFALWGAKHGIPFAEVYRAAGYGGLISAQVRRVGEGGKWRQGLT